MIDRSKKPLILNVIVIESERSWLISPVWSWYYCIKLFRGQVSKDSSNSSGWKHFEMGSLAWELRLRPTVEGDFGRTLLTRVAKKFNILVTCRISMCNFVSAQDKASGGYRMGENLEFCLNRDNPRKCQIASWSVFSGKTCALRDSLECPCYRLNQHVNV